jgi:hypothetical protein
MRALAHAGKSGRRVISAFAQNDANSAKQQWRRVADQLRPKIAKLATLMDEAETDRPRLHDLPTTASGEAALYQPARSAQRRDQAPHRLTFPPVSGPLRAGIFRP